MNFFPYTAISAADFMSLPSSPADRRCRVQRTSFFSLVWHIDYMTVVSNRTSSSEAMCRIVPSKRRPRLLPVSKGARKSYCKSAVNGHNTEPNALTLLQARKRKIIANINTGQTGLDNHMCCLSSVCFD